MPTYEYRCPTCGDFDVFQSMTEAPLSACPTCGSPVSRKISGGAGLLFKGSGFYITDYRSSDYQARAKADRPGIAGSAPATDSTASPGPPAGSGGNSSPSSPSAAPTSGDGPKPSANPGGTPSAGQGS